MEHRDCVHNLDGWHRASGCGKRPWRVVFGHPRSVERCDRRGKPILYKTWQAAQKVADQLNREQPSGPKA